MVAQHDGEGAGVTPLPVVAQHDGEGAVVTPLPVVAQHNGEGAVVTPSLPYFLSAWMKAASGVAMKG